MDLSARCSRTVSPALNEDFDASCSNAGYSTKRGYEAQVPLQSWPWLLGRMKASCACDS